jgi:hypothetical protein
LVRNEKRAYFDLPDIETVPINPSATRTNGFLIQLTINIQMQLGSQQ